MYRSLSHNIKYLYILKLSKWLMLIMPIAALFYNENNLDHFSIFLLQAVYSLSVAFMEIPSGYLADMVGRRTTLILGAVLGTLGFIIYGLSYSLTGFIIAEITLGLGGSFISGSDSAMLFDSLTADDRRADFLRYEGRITAAGNFAETIAALCGGLIAAFAGYRDVYLLQAVIAATAIPAALFLVEPPRATFSRRPGMKHILEICRTTLLVDRKLASAILLSAVTGVATLCMAWSAQVFFVYHGLSELGITPLWICLNLTVAIVAAFSIQVKEFIGAKVSMLLIICYLPAGYIFLGTLPFLPAIISLFLFYGVRGYATPVLKDLINNHCEPSVRATVLSIRSLIIRFGFALIGPGIGIVSNHFSLPLALALAGILLLIFSIVTGSWLFRKLPEEFS